MYLLNNSLPRSKPPDQKVTSAIINTIVDTVIFVLPLMLRNGINGNARNSKHDRITRINPSLNFQFRFFIVIVSKSGIVLKYCELINLI